MYNIASISLFILLSAQLPRTLNLILENNLVSFEYFSFWQWTELKVCKFDIDCWFLSEFYFILCMFCIFVCINFVYFLCQELSLFYVHFFFTCFFSSKIFNFTDVLFYYVLANRQFRYPTSLQCEKVNRRTTDAKWFGLGELKNDEKRAITPRWVMGFT